jgi:hypothetical protein
LTKYGLGDSLGDFFKKSSGHPALLAEDRNQRFDKKLVLTVGFKTFQIVNNDFTVSFVCTPIFAVGSL